MFHYKAKEAWAITTSSFTEGAVELAKSNRVRLMDGRELEDWLDDIIDEA
jgi:restriction endonuclease Mrr